MRQTWVLGGMIMIIIGLLITVYDYPQIRYLDNIEEETRSELGDELNDKHLRLQIEFTIGSVVLVMGGIMIVIGIIRKNTRGSLAK